MLVHHLVMLLAAASFAVVALSLTYMALRSNTATVMVLLAVWVATIAFTNSVDLSVTAAGIRISALDVISTTFGVVGVARALSQGVQNSSRGLALILFGFTGIHIARGIAAVGVQTAVSDARGWFYFSGALVYASTVPNGWDARVWKLLAGVGLFLAAAAVPYLLVDGLHPATQEIFRNGTWTNLRPIVAAGSLLILQSAIIAPALGWPSKRSAFWFMLGAGAVVVLLQHRTVWVAGLVVAAVGFVSWSARRLHDTRPAVFAATGIVILALPVAIWGFMSTGALVTSAKEAASSNSTFTWRTTSWTDLISSHRSLKDIAFGGGSGSNWNRRIGAGVTDASPHDVFVDGYLRFGLPGVSALVLLGLVLWRRRAEVAVGSGLAAGTVGLLLLTQLLFGVAYNLDAVQGVIDGILVSGLAVSSQARIPPPRSAGPVVPFERRSMST